MEAFAAAAPAAGVFAGSGIAARPLFLRRNRGVSRYGAGRVRLLRVPPPRVGGDGGELPQLDQWDMMELDFGRFLGEDPKLTLAKILVKKSDPDASSLDVEKLIATKKDKLDDILREFMDANNKKDQTFKTPESGSSSNTTNPAISRPIEGKQSLNISRPVMGKPKQDGPPLTLLRPTGSKPRLDESSLTQLQPGGSNSKADDSALTLSRPVGSRPKAHGKVVQDWPSKESLAAATEFLNVLQPLLMELLLLDGFSISLQDFNVPKALLEEAQINIQKQSLILEQSRCSKTQFVEMRVENNLKNVKQQISDFIAKCSNLGLLIDPKKDSAMSKVVQQLGFVGLQLYREGKLYSSRLVEDCFSNFVNKHPALGNEHPPEAYGLVRSSYFHGLNPFEELVHAISTSHMFYRSRIFAFYFSFSLYGLNCFDSCCCDRPHPECEGEGGHRCISPD